MTPPARIVGSIAFLATFQGALAACLSIEYRLDRALLIVLGLKRSLLRTLRTTSVYC